MGAADHDGDGRVIPIPSDDERASAKAGTYVGTCALTGEAGLDGPRSRSLGRRRALDCPYCSRVDAALSQTFPSGWARYDVAFLTVSWASGQK